MFCSWNDFAEVLTPGVDDREIIIYMLLCCGGGRKLLWVGIEEKINESCNNFSDERGKNPHHLYLHYISTSLSGVSYL